MHMIFGNDLAGCALIGACALLRTNTVINIFLMKFSISKVEKFSVYYTGKFSQSE